VRTIKNAPQKTTVFVDSLFLSAKINKTFPGCFFLLQKKWKKSFSALNKKNRKTENSLESVQELRL